ncbi:Inositol-1,4,5-trisphosphate 5-phosphatase 1 [Savitreella phatthalungensis]
MSLTLYRRDRSRAYAISNDSWTLTFRQEAGSGARSSAEFIPAADWDQTEYKPLRLRPIYGCLGLVPLDDHVFLGIVTGCSPVARIREGETIQRIHAVEFYCLDDDRFDPKFFDSNGNQLEPGQEELFEATERTDAHPCEVIRELLSAGSFYFSSDHDVSLNLQSRAKQDHDPESFDRQFLWNDFLIGPLIAMRDNMNEERRKHMNEGRFLTSIIRGFAETIQTSLGNLTLISRLSSRRAGTRFNARGIDDEGNVANFVETETVLDSKQILSSFCQVRGSVPLFWEQTSGGLLGGHKVEVTRSPTATQAAFERHFASLLEKYGGEVHVVNLLGTASSEQLLTGLYRTALRDSPFGDALHITEFDFHNETRGGYEGAVKIKPLLSESANRFGSFVKGKSVQRGVFRTNCLDCLDRTNMVQNIISQADLEAVLGQQVQMTFWERHGHLWANNGDALSQIYAGTGALKTSFTRRQKMSLAGAIADATKSAARMYINNFQDRSKQEIIDLMLGRLVDQMPVNLYDPIADWVNEQTRRRASEWSQSLDLRIFCGTFNLNGKISDEDLSPWLKNDADIVSIAFQEIVELTPAQIVSADPEKLRMWTEMVMQTLGPSYVLIRTGQLVGAALLLLVKQRCLTHIRNVEGASKKTGLRGMSGNKGGVAIRLEYGATRLCFVNSHLAAGHSNHHERNADYNTILQGLKFNRGRTIVDHHDAVFWSGDFNYRIDLPIEQVRHCIEARDYETLFEADQLNREMVKGKVFRFFHEKQITFPPTYKFDNGTDEYDTSDKQRIPAWTDRVLKKGAIATQEGYDSAPLRLSDHKPVWATFKCQVQLVDEATKSQIERGLYRERQRQLAKGDVGDDVSSVASRSLPQPSTDRHKWWIENHSTAKSNVVVPPGMRLNPARPANPWRVGEPVFQPKPPVPPRRKPTEPVGATSADGGRGPGAGGNDGGQLGKLQAKPDVPARPSSQNPSGLTTAQKAQQQQQSGISKPKLPPRQPQTASAVGSGDRVDNGADTESETADHLSDNPGNDQLSNYKSLV